MLPLTSCPKFQVTYPPPPVGPPAIYMPLEYATAIENSVSDRPVHYVSQYCVRPEMYRTDSNYLTFDVRDQGLPPLPPPATYVERAYPSEYTSGGVHYVAGADGCYHAYDNPSSSVSSSSTNPRTPSRLAFGGGHRRTPSNVSNASSTNTSSSNINPSFRLEDEDSQYSTPSRSRLYDCEYPSSLSPYYVRQNSAPAESDRPGTLELTSRMRSGMRKYNYSPNNSSCKPPSGSGWGSGAGTPTNPTPPDSLTSEDSSYVSAKDSSSSRVRFLPGVVCSETLLDIPVPAVDSTVPLQASMARHLRLGSSSRKPSVSELEREFLS